MGKAARNRGEKKNKFYKKAQQEEAQTPMSRELLSGLDSPEEATRISTSGAISAMFGDIQSDMNFSDDLSSEYKSNLEMVTKSNLLKKIISRATDKSPLVCMNILGALRNMCVVGGDSFISTAYDLNVMEALRSLLYKNLDVLQKGSETDKLIVCNIYYQLFSLLTILLDYDPSGFYQLETDGTHSICDAIQTILAFSPASGAKLLQLTDQMRLSTAEFLTVTEEQLGSSPAFLQQVVAFAQQQDWPLRFKLLGACLSTASLKDRAAILRDAAQILQHAGFAAALAQVDALYKQFEAMEAPAPKSDAKEEVMDDVDATSRMDTEALDGGESATAAGLVAQAQALTQQLNAYLGVLDVAGRILSRDDADAAPLALPTELPQQLYAVLSSTYAELVAQEPQGKQAQLLRSALVVGVLEALAALLPYLQQAQLLSVWSALVAHLQLSEDVARTTVSLLWKWSQCVGGVGGFSDSVNPVCFSEQVAPLLPLLQSGCGELEVQLLNLLAALLTRVQGAPAKNASVVEVCRQAVHCLDAETNARNAEVLGCFLDFMMTVFGSDAYVPVFRSLQCTQTVMDATSALQKALRESASELDEDALEYLNEILSNAFAFISWIQGGMN
ncbi:hypothetical protein AV274_0113 [Blastocystis sp. ATCC 50177/Nand II]|uniref:Uncharacterized protein n=1 Tax=Blastocystis sp. subtype 1 (strain ATCC 50177 / NandII) TaxID=478820 RepID=A0A196SQV3_BLAHN|nr:hypothetical protein AV274_0113 [Blastocystis sp. ATCC 50177/Nand II]